MHRFTSLCLAWLAAAGIVASGCTSAGLCDRGALGCECTQSSRCDDGARCDNGMCVESDDPPDPPDAGTPDTGPPPTPGDCSGDVRIDACQDFCEAFCQNQERLCVDSSCLPGDCETGGELLQVCLDTCDTASCAQDLCEAESERTCESFGYMEGDVFLPGCFEADPMCVLEPSLGCSDTCGTLSNGTGGDLVDNGRCEDSGEGSVDSLCPRSTDCTDCGTRTCVEAGEECENHGDCCGFFGDGAFCVEVSGSAICLTTCTESRTCPDGEECLPVDDNRNFVCAPM